MGIKVQDLMSEAVVRCRPEETVGTIRELMARKRVQAIPVVTEADELLGIVTSTDLIRTEGDQSDIGRIMTRKVYTVPLYGDVAEAARLMKKHRLHHVVVTNERKVVGILSTFDLLVLVEGRRFVEKKAPTPTKQGLGRRKRGTE